MHTVERMARRIWTPAVAEIALGLVMAALIAMRASGAARTDPNWPFGLAVGVALCATALLRRPRPGVAVVVGLVLFGAAGAVGAIGGVPPDPLFGGGLVGLLVLGADAVQTLRPRFAVIVGAAGAAVIATGETVGVAGFFDNRALHALAGATAWGVALAAGIWLRYLDFRRRETVRAVRREERLELARELHDVVAHHVTGIVVQAQAAGFAGGEDTGRLLATLSGIETAGLETLAAIRQLVGLLRGPDDASGVSPVPEPISRLVERFADHGPAVDLRLPDGPATSGWPPQVTNTVYRVVQEALTNITRHAPAASRVTVTVTHGPRQVGVEITDDAPASQHSRAGTGYGLVGMRERVEALGGQLRAGPRPAAGWVVCARLPVRGQP